MTELSEEQKKEIKDFLNKNINLEEFKLELKSREEHRISVVELITKESLNKMDEISFGKLISNLWASDFWGNKDYLIESIIQKNSGIENIKKALYNLLYGEGSIYERFNNYKIKGLGPSSITEILCLYDPEKYGIWNFRVRKSLKILKFNNLPLEKYQITGNEYQKINDSIGEIAKELAKELKNFGIPKADMLTTDYFLYKIPKNKIKVDEETEDESNFDHDEIRDRIKEIGINLGFEAETESEIATGSQIDVIWSTKIANLGEIRYIFEVQKSGSIDSLIVNLQRSLNNPTVQKVIAVSDKKQLEKIKKEISTIKALVGSGKLGYWSVSDVNDTYENLSKVMENINKLELVKTKYE